jgi:putative hydrolase of the HAD superfamily
VSTEAEGQIAKGEGPTFVTGMPDIDTWIFDLDDTLYPRSSGLHERMVMCVISLIQQRVGLDVHEAKALHLKYYELYGTSMVGLFRHHDISPRCFLDSIHDVDLSCIGEAAQLKRSLAALPGRRIVFTNGSRRHAERILDHLGFADLFPEICDIESCEFVGKPSRKAYDTLLSRQGIHPARAAMFDDRSVNLRIPSQLGMKTILVDPVQWDSDEAHVDAVTTDLAFFLSSLLSGARIPSRAEKDGRKDLISVNEGAGIKCASNT